jgi:hypothetical protein
MNPRHGMGLCGAVRVVRTFLNTYEYDAPHCIRESNHFLGYLVSSKLTDVPASMPIVRLACPAGKIGLQFKLKPFADFIDANLFDVGTSDAVKWIAKFVLGGASARPARAPSYRARKRSSVPVCARLCPSVPVCARLCPSVPVCARLCPSVPVCGPS